MSGRSIPPSRHSGRSSLANDLKLRLEPQVLVEVFDSGFSYDANRQLETLIDAYEEEEIPPEKLLSLSGFIATFLAAHPELTGSTRAALTRIRELTVSASQRREPLTLSL